MPRILVMDDDPMVRFVVCQILTRNGHSTVEAGDWTTGTARLRTERVDLVITDLLMPSPGSLQFIRAKRDGFPHLPLIVMSGVFDPASYSGIAASMGASGTLSKPFTSRELLDAVMEVLTEERVGAEPLGSGVSLVAGGVPQAAVDTIADGRAAATLFFGPLIS